MLNRIFYTVLAFITIAAPQIAIAQNRAIPQNQEQMQLSFAPVVKKISPAVVNIYTKRTVSRRVASPFFNDPFFNRFFGQRDFGQRMRKQVESSLGSGVIIDPKGVVITNAHVIKGADEITVVLNDGREFDARITITDEPSDLAVLRLNEVKEKLPAASLKSSESLEVGDLVLAIGNPFGFGQTVTSGIVSAQGRSSLNINDFNFFIQTDAAINPGNSGGPLVSLDGGVVGINTAIYSRDGGSLGIGFAVPSEMVSTVLAAEERGEDTQLNQGRIRRPWLGVTAQNVTSDIAESLGIERPRGVLIAKLHKYSPLKSAGIKVGDVVVEMNGHKIRDAGEMKFRMATVALGDKADVTILRRDQEVRLKVKAITAPDKPERNQITLSGSHPLNGATIANLNPAVAEEIGIAGGEVEEGVVVMKAPSRGYFRVLQAGDFILSINDRETLEVKDVEKALRKYKGGGWTININRNGQTRQIILK